MTHVGLIKTNWFFSHTHTHTHIAKASKNRPLYKMSRLAQDRPHHVNESKKFNKHLKIWHLRWAILTFLIFWRKERYMSISCYTSQPLGIVLCKNMSKHGSHWILKLKNFRLKKKWWTPNQWGILKGDWWWRTLWVACVKWTKHEFVSWVKKNFCMEEGFKYFFKKTVSKILLIRTALLQHFLRSKEGSECRNSMNTNIKMISRQIKFNNKKWLNTSFIKKTSITLSD